MADSAAERNDPAAAIKSSGSGGEGESRLLQRTHGRRAGETAVGVSFAGAGPTTIS